MITNTIRAIILISDWVLFLDQVLAQSTTVQLLLGRSERLIDANILISATLLLIRKVV